MQVKGAHGAKGDLLGQVVEREGPSVPQHHCLAQQVRGWANLKLLTLRNDIKRILRRTSPYMSCISNRSFESVSHLIKHLQSQSGIFEDSKCCIVYSLFCLLGVLFLTALVGALHRVFASS